MSDTSFARYRPARVRGADTALSLERCGQLKAPSSSWARAEDPGLPRGVVSSTSPTRAGMHSAGHAEHGSGAEHPQEGSAPAGTTETLTPAEDAGAVSSLPRHRYAGTPPAQGEASSTRPEANRSKVGRAARTETDD